MWERVEMKGYLLFFLLSLWERGRGEGAPLILTFSPNGEKGQGKHGGKV